MLRWAGAALVVAVTAAAVGAHSRATNARSNDYELNDSHFHLTNYIQEGPDLRHILALMDRRIGRVALFGIPLQQTWSYRIDGDRAPTYYLQTDAPLYYYSFTDAYIATAYKSLPREQQARFDPMITGFNPADMYGVDHIRRVLRTYPGVFSGIGEFTVHKEFVSAKIAGETPSLEDPALDRILDFAAESGLLVLIHNDVTTPFPKANTEPQYLEPMKGLLKRHSGATIIWAHAGLGRVIQPFTVPAGSLEKMLADPAFHHVYFDISWDEVCKYLVATPESTKRAADLINRYSDRFLFGTDAVAPVDQASWLKVYEQYGPLWRLLDKEASEKVRKKNYERLFDQARVRVRAWEKSAR